MKKRKKQGNYQLKSTPCPFKAITSNTTPPKKQQKTKKNNTHKKPKNPTTTKIPKQTDKKKPKYNYVWYLQSYLKKNYNS